ncbi:hypothetical protein ACSYAY_04960 [Leptospirillum ferriphilum]|jgi:uncharacterized membrane protein|uniref:Uncharacterized protein n=2 Tax=Leptospirillum TaxID=179 RepID=A0A094W7Y2_9BACT|nr:hypothetical protein [Leptospirillum ferriphilum]EDZ38703.1 MAG: Hypothetical protein CGL2_11238051 [Leptospirillum sp. Group II '5-way CG']KGA92565.1 hypothetical protein LptCag_0017 [Leptospirillum ferriphilum]
MDPASVHDTRSEETEGGTGPADEEKMTGKDWMRVFVYFVLGLFLLFVFFYMIFAGPKAALIAGVTLLVGIVLWVIFRYVLKEIA